MTRNLFMLRIRAGIIASVLVAAGPPARADTPLTTRLLTDGLAHPVFVNHAPDDPDRIFILERPGQIRIVKKGKLLAAPFLDINPLIRSVGLEQGLLGLAFHPNYNGDPEQPGHREFFVNYTDNDGDTVIARYRRSDDPDLAETDETLVVTFDQPFPNHNGGWMDFGPDGYLYISTGDGGDHNDPHGNGQNVETLLGKILRIDVDGDDFPGDDGVNYAVPPTNPLVGLDGRNEIWAYGLRNPWRCAFDAATGDLFIADVGEQAVEEVNFQPAASSGGANYGWRCLEGSRCTGLSGCDCEDPSITLPIHEYERGGMPFRCSITGGEVYRGSAIPDLGGTYFFADYCSRQIWSFRLDGETVTDFRDRTCELSPQGGRTIANISSFGHDHAGEMYICDLFGGEVFKIVPATGIVDSLPPAGAVDARQPSDPDGSNLAGWDAVELEFDIGLGCAVTGDFSVTQQGGEGAPPEPDRLEVLSSTRLRLWLTGPIRPAAWTTITHLPSGSSIRLGFLPGDVTGDAVVGADDVAYFLDLFQGGQGAFNEWSLDLDRSGRFDQLDLLTLADLLAGVGAFTPYLGASLP